MGYMIVEKGFELTDTGNWKRTKDGDLIPCGVTQVRGTNTYEDLVKARRKLRSIIKNPDYWGYEEGDLFIVKFEKV